MIPGGDVKLVVEKRFVRGITSTMAKSQRQVKIEQQSRIVRTWDDVVILLRWSRRFALSDHIRHGPLVAEALLHLPPRLVVEFGELGSDVALLL